MKYSHISLTDFSYLDYHLVFSTYLLVMEAPAILISKQQFKLLYFCVLQNAAGF